MCEPVANTECIENQNAVLKGRASASQNSIQMGSEMGHSMYYTEAEPPMELIGRKRHYFGKPNQRGQSQGNLSVLRPDDGQNLNTIDQNQLNPEVQQLLQRLFSAKGVR